MRILLFIVVLFVGIEALAQVSVSPSQVNFLNVEVGGFGDSRTVFVNNMSREDLNVHVSHTCFGDFFVSNTCFQLRRFGSCTIRVEYRPIRVGSDICTINVMSRGQRSDFDTIFVSGQGVDRR